jgi:hypothetical protein
MIVKLSKPITVAGEPVSELDLREATVEDVADIGYPFSMVPGDNGTEIKLDVKAVLKYVSRLAGVPPSSLKTISLGDLSTLQTVVMGFFGEEAATPPSS